MAYVNMKTAVVYVTEEVGFEGVAVEPTAGDQAVEISDAFDLQVSKELIERTTLSGSIAQRLPRTGMKSATASVSVEARASSTAGSAPDAGLLFESALGGTRAMSATTTTLATTNLTTIPVLLGTGIKAGDIVMLKDLGSGFSGYHVSPVTASAANGTNDDTITLLAPCAAAPATGTVIEKFTTYFGADSGHPSLTITEFLEDALKRQAVGCKVNSLSLEGFEPGGTASFNFSLSGLDGGETVQVSGLTEAFGDALPPLVLDACVFKDGVPMEASAFTFSVENTLPVIPSLCSPSGKAGQRVTGRAVSGSFTVYADTTNVNIFEAFEDGTQFSLYASLYNPGASLGIKKEVIGVYIPVCIVTAAPMANAEGLMVYNVEFRAGPDATGSDIYLGFI
jgi:hypothetical protein